MIDWDKWNQIWKLASNASAKLADTLAAHKFAAPMVSAVAPGEQECFCGWSGPDHFEHLKEQIDPKPQEAPEPPTAAEPKKAAKAAPRKAAPAKPKAE